MRSLDQMIKTIINEVSSKAFKSHVKSITEIVLS
jgi:hypothetical protein